MSSAQVQTCLVLHSAFPTVRGAWPTHAYAHGRDGARLLGAVDVGGACDGEVHRRGGVYHERGVDHEAKHSLDANVPLGYCGGTFRSLLDCIFNCICVDCDVGHRLANVPLGYIWVVFGLFC